MAEPTYFAADHGDLIERDRLATLEAELDPQTIRHLRALGLGDASRAWRCLEVGGGGGSIARWLAHEVGDAGHVTVTDVDTRFLTGLQSPNLTVRRHDVAHDRLEPLAYDLVHCRLVLVHLADVAAAVKNMADAVAPGGVLLLEEFEYGTLSVAERSHHLTAEVERVNHALLELTAAMGIDACLGRRLPDLLEAAGLSKVDHVATLRIRRGTPEPTMAKASTALLAPKLVADGSVTQHDIDAWFDALADPTFRMIDYAMVAAWGHRPVL